MLPHDTVVDLGWKSSVSLSIPPSQRRSHLQKYLLLVKYKGIPLLILILIALGTILTVRPPRFEAEFPPSSPASCEFACSSQRDAKSGGLSSLNSPKLVSDVAFGPIDIVFTWVNGSDPSFVADMNRYGAKASLGRYRDYDTLRYALRSVERFAPWINHIYLVTNGQVPNWLNLKEDRITVVTHKEIFEDLDDLPTFSSRPIESHLHRIPKLNERFVYCNDDMMFGSPMSVADFWKEPSTTIVYRSKEKIPQSWETPSSIWLKSLQHANSVLNSDPDIPDHPGRRFAAHHCYNFRKSVLREMSYRFRHEYYLTRQSRFRSAGDLTIPFLYANYVEYADVSFEIEEDSSFVYLDITNNVAQTENQLSRIDRTKPKFLCFQDQFGKEGPTDEILDVLSGWFASYFKTPSSFEKK